MDVPAEQWSYLTHDGLDDNSLSKSRTVNAVLNCDGKDLSRVSLVPRRHGLEEWRVQEKHEGIRGNRTAALLGGIFNPLARLVKMKKGGSRLW